MIKHVILRQTIVFYIIETFFLFKHIIQVDIYYHIDFYIIIIYFGVIFFCKTDILQVFSLSWKTKFNLKYGNGIYRSSN